MSSVLSCDAAGCGHVEPVEAILEADIGRLCPKCGANLLTREDFDYWAAHIEPMVRALEDLGLVRDGQPDGGEASLFFGHHAGKTTIIRDAGV